MKAIKFYTTIITIFLAAFFSGDLIAQTTGTISVRDSEYGNGYNNTWEINTGGANSTITFNYYLSTESSYDYVRIYQLDSYGVRGALIIALTGQNNGTTSVLLPSGRAQVEFTSDGSVSYADGNTTLWGFEIDYSATLPNNAPNATENLDVSNYGYIGGNLEVGTRNSYPSSQLNVNGKIKAREVTITDTGWADFVFDENYHLPSLSSVEQHILTNKHLPEIPSAAEVKAKGINMADMQIKLLQKIEELTLYVIEQQKEIEGLKKGAEIGTDSSMLH